MTTAPRTQEADAKRQPADSPHRRRAGAYPARRTGISSVVRSSIRIPAVPDLEHVVDDHTVARNDAAHDAVNTAFVVSRLALALVVDGTGAVVRIRARRHAKVGVAVARHGSAFGAALRTVGIDAADLLRPGRRRPRQRARDEE